MQLDDELRQIFLEEADAYLEALTRPEATLEEQGDAAHGLKGAAGMLALTELSELAQTLERSLRAGEVTPRDELLPRVLALVETLRTPRTAATAAAAATATATATEGAPSQEPPGDAGVDATGAPEDAGADATGAPPTEAGTSGGSPTGKPTPAPSDAPRKQPGPSGGDEDFDPETAAMLRGFFIEEAQEHLGHMEQEFTRLEKDPLAEDAVDALFRSSHTIKGAAATVGLSDIAAAAHRLEDRFEELRNPPRPLTPALRERLMSATDLLRAMVEGDAPSSHAERYQALCALLADAEAASHKTDESPPSVAPRDPAERAGGSPSSPEPAPASPPEPAPASQPGLAPASPPEPLTGSVSADDGWDDETRALLRETFAEEAREILEQLDPGVETLWKAGPAQADLDAIFRMAHTLKGSAAAVGLDALSRAAHRLEDHFDALRADAGAPPSGAHPDLLGALATLHDLVDAAASDAPPAVFENLLSRFMGAMEGKPFAPEAPGSTGPSSPTDARFAAPGEMAAPELETPAAPGKETTAGASATKTAAPPPAAPKLRPPADSLPELAPLKVGRRQTGPLPTKGGHEAGGSAEGAPPEHRLGDDRRQGARRQEDDRMIRVHAGRFDALLNAVGEIVFRRTLIERRSEELTGLVRDLGRSHQSLRAAIVDLRNLRGAERHVQRLSELEVEFADELSNFERAETGLREETEGLRRDAQFLQDGLTQIRLLSVKYLFARLRRAVRDIARTEGKQVDLHTEGEDTEIDRLVAEKLADPMVQIIRNAVAHGIEPPAERRARGKPEQGRVNLHATQEGNFVTLEVRDDGGGIDVDDLRDALVSKGLMSRQEAQEATEDEVTSAIFLPGFSTRSAADTVAGRGVGLDVVHDAVVKLGGEVAVTSERGQGTRFQVRMPLSTAVDNALLFKSGGEVYCIPVRHVVETRYLHPRDVLERRGRKAIELRGRPQPLIFLDEMLSIESRRQGKFLPTIVLRHLDFEFAVVVDKLVGPREIVLRKLGPLLEPVSVYTSATISGAGKVQMVLDVAVLHEFASAWRTLAAARARSSAPARRRLERARILVCDDSRSIRQVVSRILTEEGFSVELASDGWDAWEQMTSINVDLLLTDLEMPRMDGYALVEKCRKDELLGDLPILVLSSRTGEENQRRAREAGANGFLFKPVNRRVIVARIEELLAAR
jgi:chemosensory pili system protein ChpA (sensor histidine kinase/response regulator)